MDNAGFYEATDLVEVYDTSELRPVELVILDRYRDDFAGRVLEVGCGGGRLTGHLCRQSPDVHGIDVSSGMIEHCRRHFPQATFTQADMRNLGGSGLAPFDVLFASFNVIDAVDHPERRQTLGGFRDKMAPGGLLVMSSHNLAFAPRLVGPGAELVSQLRSGRLRTAAGGAARLRRRARNRRRLRKLESHGCGYAILNDVAHDYSLLHYYVAPSFQARQLAVHGFELLECLDLEGRPFAVGDSPADCPEIHYVARAATP